ncbi:MAG: hypothetical protein ACOX1L_07555 [Erysipelotrichaceae bacterium]|jgi:ABC-type multidrug transport system fused ATPase/permease subunit
MPGLLFDPFGFFDIITIIFPILFFSFIAFFIYVTITSMKANKEAGRVTRYVSSQFENILSSQANNAAKSESEKDHPHSRNEFHKYQKKYSYKNVDSYNTDKDIIKDKSLSEAERNVLHGK